MAALFRANKQPFKTLYVLQQLVSTGVLRVPVWVLLCLVSRRPRQSWSIVRTVLVQLIRHYIRVTFKTGPLFSEPNHLAVVPDSGGVWVDVPPASIANDDLRFMAAASKATFVRLPGYWNPALGEAPLVGKTLYALHGGGYASGSAHPRSAFARITDGIVASCPSITRIFAIEYRLSTGGKHAFPTALFDAISGYYYLVNTMGIPAASIVIEGDSAGGHLALALVRYITTSALLPIPGGLLLNSPWADLGTSHDGSTPFPSTSSFALYADYDPEPCGMDASKLAFLGPSGWGIAEVNGYVSPGSRHVIFNTLSFRGFPPTFISAGGAENLLPQIKLLEERIRRDLGDSVVFMEAKDACHDYLLFQWQEPQRKDTLNAIALWIQSLE